MRTHRVYIPPLIISGSILLFGVLFLSLSMQILYAAEQATATSVTDGLIQIRSEHELTMAGRLHQVLWETVDFWKYLLSCEVPGLELSENNNDEFGTVSLAAYLFVDVDVTDPKTFLSSQIPFLNKFEYISIEEEIPPLVAESPPPLVGELTMPNNGAGIEQSNELSLAAAFAGKPPMLIYHTHTTEAYVPDCGERYVKDNPDVTVVKVGEHLTNQLNQYGVPVYHASNNHVWEPFWASYSHSLVTVQNVLRDQPQVRYVLDIHNDGIKRSNTTISIDGKIYARMYFVVGADNSRNPRWQQNHKFALRLQAKCEQRYPGLSRGILLRETARYNQHMRDNSLLIEMGGYENSLEEALRTADVLAELLIEIMLEDLGAKV